MGHQANIKQKTCINKKSMAQQGHSKRFLVGETHFLEERWRGEGGGVEKLNQEVHIGVCGVAQFLCSILVNKIPF